MRLALLAAVLKAAAGAPAAAPEPQDPVVAEAAGAVAVWRDGSPERALPGARLAPGMELRAADGASALLVFGPAAKLRLRGGVLRLEERAADRVTVRLERGALDAWVDAPGGRRFRVRSPAGSSAVRGRGVFRVETDGRGSTIDLYRGELGVTDARGRGLIMTSGQRVRAAPAGVDGVSSLPRGLEADAEPGLGAGLAVGVEVR